MNQEEAILLQAIGDDPDDDEVRLVYADWLEDNGQLERAAFIRAQVQLARMHEDDPERPALVARERALLEAHSKVWLDALPPLDGAKWHPSFHRGFVNGATAQTWKAFDSQAETIFAAAPVEWVCFNSLTPRTARSLAWSPRLERIRRLDLQGRMVRDERVLTLLRSPYLCRLVELRLRGTAAPPGGQFEEPGRAVAQAVADAPALKDLTSLHLWHLGIGWEGAAALADSPYLKGLTELDLAHSGSPNVPGGGHIGPGGALALARSPYLRHLEVLKLGGQQIGPGVGALAAWRRLAGLRVLDLQGNNVGPAGVRALARSPHLAGLVDLDLQSNGTGDEGARALADSPQLRRFTRLALSRNEVGDAGGPGVGRFPLPGETRRPRVALQQPHPRRCRGAAPLATSAQPPAPLPQLQPHCH
jgi:uncharacterized protein (TIGR02996 family)